MTANSQLFFEHLIPQSTYQTVRELSSSSPEAERVIQKILLTAVLRVLLETCSREVLQKNGFFENLPTNPGVLSELSQETKQNISLVVRQTLDRTLLALTATLQQLE